MDIEKTGFRREFTGYLFLKKKGLYMNTSGKLPFISTGGPSLDSKLGDGFRRGKLTELVGPPDSMHPLAVRTIKLSLAEGRGVGLIDYAHDLFLWGKEFRKLALAQPTELRTLPVYLNRFGRDAFDLVVVNLGSEVWVENEIPQSAVDDDLRFALLQACTAVHGSNLACVTVSERPVMPGGPTVVQPAGKNPDTGLLEFTVGPEAEAGAQRRGQSVPKSS